MCTDLFVYLFNDDLRYKMKIPRKIPEKFSKSKNGKCQNQLTNYRYKTFIHHKYKKTFLSLRM